MKPQFLKEKTPWILAEDIPNADLFFSSIWLYGYVNTFVEHTGKMYKKTLCKYEGYHLWFYFGEEDSFVLGEHIADRIVGEKGYLAEINRNIVLQADKLRTFSETIPQANLSALSDEDLWFFFIKHYEAHHEYYSWAWIPVVVDMFHNNLTNRVKDYLRSKGIPEERLNQDFITLTQPTAKSLIFIEQEDLLKIAGLAEGQARLLQAFSERSATEIVKLLPEDIAEALKAHWKKYYYTKHLWVSGEYTIDDYINQLKDIFATKQSATDILRKQNEELEKAKQKREKLLAELNIEPAWRAVLSGFGDFMITKIYRRYAQLLAVHHMSAVLKEIARRRFVTEKQVRFMLPQEVKSMLLENKFDGAELLERTKFCAYYLEQGFEKIFVGAEAKQFMKGVEKEVDYTVSELKGEGACVGYAKGKVKIIIRAEDMTKMEVGDILVSIATDPDIVPAMKKAAAIVTEQGGVTSHAAIVSRELGIPCVIGTKIATRVLKDGDMVEVDANKGIVRKL